MKDFELDPSSLPVITPFDDVGRLLYLFRRVLIRADVTHTRENWETVNRIACDLWSAVIRLLSHVEDEHWWDLGTTWDD